MRFFQEPAALIGKAGHETLRIEAWGANSLRVRSTMNPAFEAYDWVLQAPQSQEATVLLQDDGSASIENGAIKAVVNRAGVISFYKGDKRILHEYRSNYNDSENEQSLTLKYEPRQFKGIAGGDWSIIQRFDGSDDEMLFGMGQYQVPYMNLKGRFVELNQRNSQVSVPFLLSNLGYGLFWNSPAVGRATFGMDQTEWSAAAAKQLDYWITAADEPKAIIEQFTEMTGRAPGMPDDLLGLWQCKLRYRTQQEVLDVARKYHELGVPCDVIVIDFFHFLYQGEWDFDKKYWPDVKGMCEELESYGTKVMVSVWPTVDRRSSRFYEMMDLGYLMQTERGAEQTYSWQGDCVEVDLFNPDARKYFWDICKKNYYDQGVKLFWLDNIEPDLAVYDYENYRYYGGPHLEVGNLYPELASRTFYEGLMEAGEKETCLLCRCGWAGSQKYASMIWSGDVQSNFATLKTQVMQGLNMGIAGIPWWNTDCGGFMTDDYLDPDFIELLLRWFAYTVFSPCVRLHGTRGPLDIDPLSDQDFGGGFLYTGHENEIWSYGEEAQKVFEKFLKIREDLKPYLASLYKEASETGQPLMRAMFLEFPEDKTCWTLKDQYMLGEKLLVAPVLEAKAETRSLYLPAGSWKDYFSDEVYEGGKTIEVKTPIDSIPVFEKLA